MSAKDLEDWCRGICKAAISTSLAAAETAIRQNVDEQAPSPGRGLHSGAVPIRRAKVRPA